MRLGNIRLDNPGDNICARRLGRHDQMNPCGARHLGDPRDGALHLDGSRLHQIRQFINNDDNVGHSIRNDQLLVTMSSMRTFGIRRSILFISSSHRLLSGSSDRPPFQRPKAFWFFGSGRSLKLVIFLTADFAKI